MIQTDLDVIKNLLGLDRWITGEEDAAIAIYNKYHGGLSRSGGCPSCVRHNYKVITLWYSTNIEAWTADLNKPKPKPKTKPKKKK
tara:strand:- start:214 stop:468 length:255 start_codon:yes stop_codon:yes gene_type:complete